MRFRELRVPGAWEITPVFHADDRGVFLESFHQASFAAATGRELDVRQVNTSVSTAGTVRGIHFAQLPPGQAKYVTCPRGAVLDFVVDIRLGSPTFGQWDAVLLDDDERRTVFISEGLGHCFVALEDGATVVYLCSAPYAPGREFGITPMCASIALDLPARGRDGSPLTLRMSEKDRVAPSLLEAATLGLLPRQEEQQAFLETLATAGG